jgi:hypothetical protein
MKTQANDAAFSRPAFHHEHTGTLHDAQEGLTKREYFAAMAMQAIVSNSNSHRLFGVDNMFDIAKGAVNMADALIEELNKQEEK